MLHPGRALSIGFVLVVILSCRSRSGDPDPGAASSSGVDAGTFDKAALLKAFGECALGGYREFQSSAALLEGATRAAETDGTPASLEAAQAAWKKAMDSWQRVEVLQFGPAAMTGLPGGQDLRDPIYAWPLVSRCPLEQILVSKAYEKPDFAATSLVSSRSLAAMEYLLFYGGSDNACPPDSEINKGAWAALGEAEIKKRKLAYARVLATDVAARAQRIVDAWDPAKGNFVAEMENAGKTRSFVSQQMAFNAVSDAMFYLDDQMKNMKVGKPAGLLPDCAAPPCLDAVESPWAKRSKDHMRANVAGYEILLKGCGAGGQGLGFDDLLTAIGAPHITKKLDDTVGGIRGALDGLKEPTFEEDLQKNPAGVKALFDALRANASVMKSEFVTALDLELPKRVEGDND